jgi:hypothetical protein
MLRFEKALNDGTVQSVAVADESLPLDVSKVSKRQVLQ